RSAAAQHRGPAVAMDSQRLVLFFVFAFSLFLLIDAWQRDQQPAAQRAPTTASPHQDTSVPPAPSDKLAAPAPPTAPHAPPGGLTAGTPITVETDVFRAEISTAGGDLRTLELKQHRDTEDKKRNFVLFQQRPD